MRTVKSFVVVVIFRELTIFSDMTSRSDPESSIALMMNEHPDWMSTTFMATIGRMTSSEAWTSFLVASYFSRSLGCEASGRVGVIAKWGFGAWLNGVAVTDSPGPLWGGFDGGGAAVEDCMMDYDGVEGRPCTWPGWCSF